MLILDIFIRLITVLMMGAVSLAAFRFIVWGVRGHLKARGQISCLYFMMVSVSVLSVALIPGWLMDSICLLYRSLKGMHGIRGWLAMQIYILEAGVLIGIWIAGVVFEVFWMAVSYRRFERMLAASNTVVTDACLLNMLEGFSVQAGLGSTPFLFGNTAVESPFVKGLRNPVIVIPLRKMSKQELVTIMAHEIEHCRRRDLLVRWIIKSSQVIYWFVPGHRFWMEEVIELQESLCDYSVCCKYKETLGNASLYYRTILEVSSIKKQVPPFFCSGLGAVKSQLVRRVENMYAMQKANRKNRCLAVGIMIVMCIAGLLLSPTIAFAYGHFSSTQKKADNQTGDELMADVEVFLENTDWDKYAESKNIFSSYSNQVVPAEKSVPGEPWICREDSLFQGFAVADSPDYEILLISKEQYFRMIPKDEICTFEQYITPGVYCVKIQNKSKKALNIELFVQE